MREVELPSGVVEYTDTGGDGPVVVLMHGVAMDGSVWRHVVADLAKDHRCVVPNLPFGCHRKPLRADADLSPAGIAALQGAFLDRLDLRDVTLVGNDSGLFQITAADHPDRVSRLVLTTCEAFENFPPGVPGTALWRAAKVPGALPFLMRTLRVRALRRLPGAFGLMSKRPIPDDVFDTWLDPLVNSPGSRNDLARFLRAAKRGDMLAAAERLRTFPNPVLVVWTPEDKVMRPEHGKRFADMLPDARLTEVTDCRTLIPEDQPARLAGLIREFVGEGVGEAV